MEETPFLDSLRIQVRVNVALIQRHFISMYGRTGLGFLMLFIEPFVIMAALMVLVSVRRMQTSATFPVLAFAFSGWGIMWICRYPINKMGSAVYGNLSFLYHRNIKLIDLLISRAIMLLMATLTSFMFIFFLYTIFVEEKEYAMIYFYISIFLTLWYSFCSSILTGIIAAFNKMGDKWLVLLSLFHAVTTGAFFMVDWLPKRYQDIALYFPLVHLTEMMRYAMFGNRVQCHFSIIYPVFFNIFLNFTIFAVFYRLLKLRVSYGTS